MRHRGLGDGECTESEPVGAKLSFLFPVASAVLEFVDQVNLFVGAAHQKVFAGETLQKCTVFQSCDHGAVFLELMKIKSFFAFQFPDFPVQGPGIEVIVPVEKEHPRDKNQCREDNEVPVGKESVDFHNLPRKDKLFAGVSVMRA